MAIFSCPMWSRVCTLLPLRFRDSESKPQVGQTSWWRTWESTSRPSGLVLIACCEQVSQGCRNITNCTKAIASSLDKHSSGEMHTHTHTHFALCTPVYDHPLSQSLWVVAVVLTSTHGRRMGFESEGLASSLSLSCVTAHKAFHFFESQHHRLHPL